MSIDVDALLSELDQIIDQPTSAAAQKNPVATRSTPVKSQFTQQQQHPHSAAPPPKSAFQPKSTISEQPHHTGSAAFELSDDDDDEPIPRKNNSTRTGAPAAAAHHTTKPNNNALSGAANNTSIRPSATNFDSSDDIDSLIADMDSAIAKPASKPTVNVRTSSNNNNSTKSTAATSSKPKSKCYPTILTSSPATSCPSLLCISCDQRILSIKQGHWNSSVDYLFFRTHYPDTEKLRDGFVQGVGETAYACACSWQTLSTSSSSFNDNERMDLSSLSTMRGTPAGCSDWKNLKWICTSH